MFQLIPVNSGVGKRVDIVILDFCGIPMDLHEVPKEMQTPCIIPRGDLRGCMGSTSQDDEDRKIPSVQNVPSAALYVLELGYCRWVHGTLCL